jgi:hypothetical protein
MHSLETPAPPDFQLPIPPLYVVSQVELKYAPSLWMYWPLMQLPVGVPSEVATQFTVVASRVTVLAVAEFRTSLSATGGAAATAVQASVNATHRARIGTLNLVPMDFFIKVAS